MFNTNETRKKKIIIADDSQLNCEMLSEILGDMYEYTYVHDGDALLSLLSNGNLADMVLLDLNMPKMNGFEVLKVMKSRHWSDEIPVVVISAEGDYSIIEAAYNLGAAEYIVRPFNAFFTRHRIDTTMTQYSQRKQIMRYAERQVYERDRINKALINIFGSLVELRNSESGEHTLHVQSITKKLLERLDAISDKYKFTRESIETISTVSALHDIGKYFIPSEILNKPGKLTDEEWEIMKSHTVQGDAFLEKINVKNSEKFMDLARQIARYHHERYDGKGYPDGLCGDEIPIAAQVVSIADVYDALTSDRCYKKAYSHDKAIEMISSGRCGVFNPLLVRCLIDISDSLLVDLKINGYVGNDDDYRISGTLSIKSELQDSIRVDERIEKLLDYETEKKEFFQDVCGGIQFEYDAERRRVVYIKRYDESGKRVHLQSQTVRLLCDSDLKKVMDATSKMTPENNIYMQKVLVPIGDDMRWHLLCIRSIWSKSGGRYKTLIGVFTDIHENVLNKGSDIIINGTPISKRAVHYMREIFDVSRLIDPNTHEILKIDDDGSMKRTGQKCYRIWGRNEPCVHCTAREAYDNKKWVSKLESKEGLGYSVTSHVVKCGECECVLELGCCLDKNVEVSDKMIGYSAVDTAILQNYYHDTVTMTYSRAYLDTVLLDLDNIKAVAMIDVDDFKLINDKCGHLAGDAILKYVAETVKSCVRREDIMVRYGGDEFVLAFMNIEEEDFFKKIKSIKNTVYESARVAFPDIKPSISIGGAYGIYPITEAIDVADKEMYKDKITTKVKRTK